MPIRISGSTGISGLDGSATTPVLQGASANASGIYYSGNTVFVSTSGTNALTIGPTGNVALTNNNFSIAGQYISPYSGMMKNRIINGDMRIDQRFNGAANNNIAAVGQYVVDRWMGLGMAAGRTRFQQNNTNGPGSSATQIATGFQNYFGANIVSANASYGATDQYFISQVVEGLNIQDLNWGTSVASPVTLSFWVYSSVPGTHSGIICNQSGLRTYPFTYSINTANTWQQQIITIPGDTTGSWFSNNNIGMYVLYNLGAGSTYTASSGNSWQGAFYQTVSGAVQPQSYANGSFYLTGVQLEKGSQATAFEFRHYTTELQLCQRYYVKQTPGSSVFYSGQGWVYATSQFLFNIPFPVTMRAPPGTLQQSGTVSDYIAFVGGSSVVSTSNPVFNYASVDGIQIYFGTAATMTVGYGGCARSGSATGFLAWSAELATSN